MISCNSVMMDLLLKLKARDPKQSHCSSKTPDEHFPAMSEPDNHSMSEIEFPSILINLFKVHIPTWVVCNIVENHHELADETIYFGGWF